MLKAKLLQENLIIRSRKSQGIFSPCVLSFHINFDIGIPSYFNIPTSFNPTLDISFPWGHYLCRLLPPKRSERNLIDFRSRWLDPLSSLLAIFLGLWQFYPSSLIIPYCLVAFPFPLALGWWGPIHLSDSHVRSPFHQVKASEPISLFSRSWFIRDWRTARTLHIDLSVIHFLTWGIRLIADRVVLKLDRYAQIRWDL